MIDQTAIPSTWQPRNTGELLTLIQQLRQSKNFLDNLAAEPDTVLAAVYARKSVIEPGKTEYSMDNQEDHAQAYVEAKGWVIYHVYSDPNWTGRTEKRPGIRALKSDIKARKVKVVVIHRLDRLYRNLAGLLSFVQLLIQYDVRLISVTEEIDTSTPWGMLVLQVLGAVAEMLVRQTSERVREVKARRAASGLPNGNLPLGFCRGNCHVCTDPNGAGYCPRHGGPDLGDGRIPVWHPVDAFAIKMIFAMRQQGLSHREIAAQLNANAITLPDGLVVQFRSRGIPGRYPPAPFTRDTIRSILRNAFYAGYITTYDRPPLDMSLETA